MSGANALLVLMTAGGTGGHVYPALAVANELMERGYRVEWVGTSRGLEHRVVPAAGITLHCLPVRGVRGKSVLHKLQGLGYLMLAAVQALLRGRASGCGRVAAAQTAADPRTECGGGHHQPYAGAARLAGSGRLRRRLRR